MRTEKKITDMTRENRTEMNVRIDTVARLVANCERSLTGQELYVDELKQTCEGRRTQRHVLQI